MSPDRDLFDYLGLAIQAAILVATIVGLGFVVSSLRQGRQQQRIESGPYVRIDIGPTEGIPDQRPIEVYYEDSSQVVELSGNDKGIEVSAWFRNYQSDPLGFALGVYATFLVEIESDENGQPNLHFVDVEIPYLEFGKCSKVRLATLPENVETSVTLTALSFYDLYDKRHRHVYGEKSTNALHGRLVWVNVPADFTESTPEGRSRGKGVDYTIGAR